MDLILRKIQYFADFQSSRCKKQLFGYEPLIQQLSEKYSIFIGIPQKNQVGREWCKITLNQN
jgi:hypothetical protein